jgi:hypothetical protein
VLKGVSVSVSVWCSVIVSFSVGVFGIEYLCWVFGVVGI